MIFSPAVEVIEQFLAIFDEFEIVAEPALFEGFFCEKPVVGIIVCDQYRNRFSFFVHMKWIRNR